MFNNNKLPYGFRHGLIDFWGEGNGDDGMGDTGADNSGQTSGGSGEDNGGDRGGGYTGGGLGGDVSGDSWGRVVADKAAGYPGAGGYSVGGTGVNTGDMGFADMDGYGFVDKGKIGIGIVQDNPGKALGALGGFVFGGFPGSVTGYNVGKAVDNFGEVPPEQTVKDVIGIGLAQFGTPAVAMGFDLAVNAMSPNTTLSENVGTVVGGMLGHATTGIVEGALTGAIVGRGLGGLAPAGDNNPTNGSSTSGGTTTGQSEGGAGGGGVAQTSTTALAGADIRESASNAAFKTKYDSWLTARNARQGV